jgi:hypothetical protein
LTDRAFQKEGFIERVDIASFAAWRKKLEDPSVCSVFGFTGTARRMGQ